MKSMLNYSIYCTSEQTKRAYKLGAPIDIWSEYNAVRFVKITNEYFELPTTEQMKGWLREKNIFINVCHNCDGYGTWLKKIVPSEQIGELIGYFDEETKAVLASIDAALDYLENQNKQDNEQQED